MRPLLPLRYRARKSVEAEEGGITVFGLLIFVSTAIIGALALDVTHFYSSRTHLQVTADLAAHAALYSSEYATDEATPKALALAAVEASMPASSYGVTVDPDDIEFGTYDFGNETFVADGTFNAVRVTASQTQACNNPVPGFLFRLLGRDQWDVAAEAIFATYQPSCFREGFVAEGVVDIQSNNGFVAGFCIHSNTYVSMNQNNFFEPGTIVSMPNENDIDLPSSGFEKNEGLQAALRSSPARIRILNQLDVIIAAIAAGNWDWLPDYVTNNAVITLTNVDKLDPSMLTAGRVHRIQCKKATLTMEAFTYSNVVMIVECPIKAQNGVALEDAQLVILSTDSKSLSSPQGFRLGIDDGCAEGGGAQIYTLGGINVAASMEIYGSQIIAKGDVEFTANADGVEGASIIAGGEISGTSNMQMGFCGTVDPNTLQVDYYRMVR